MRIAQGQGRDAFRRLGLNLARLPGGLMAGLVGILIALPPVVLADIGTEWGLDAVHAKHPKAHELLQVLGDTGDRRLRIVIVLSATVVAPLFEELLFRGHLQSLIGLAFRRRYSPWPTTVDSDT